MSIIPNAEMWFDWAGDSVILVAHTTEPATWSAMCRAIAAALRVSSELRTLVLTDGGGPSRSQQTELAGVTEGKTFRASVISTAPTVRFIVSSMAFFNPTIRSFMPADWREGLGHLQVAPKELEVVEQAVHSFAQQPHADRFAVLNAVAASR